MAQSKQDRVGQGDVNLAISIIAEDDEVPNEYTDLFDGTDFNGTNDELREIRNAMKRAEDEAPMGKDKSIYDARYSLQFLYDHDE